MYIYIYTTDGNVLVRDFNSQKHPAAHQRWIIMQRRWLDDGTYLHTYARAKQDGAPQLSVGL